MRQAMTSDSALQAARMRLAGGQADAAAAACHALLLANPADADARHLFGRCLAALGRLEDAAAEFQRTLAACSALSLVIACLIVLGLSRRCHKPTSKRARSVVKPHERGKDACAIGTRTAPSGGRFAGKGMLASQDVRIAQEHRVDRFLSKERQHLAAVHALQPAVRRAA